MTECCEKCNAYKVLNPERGLCRGGLPKVFLLGVQPGANVLPGNRRAMTPVMGTFWPEVGKEEWCREYNAEAETHFHLQPNHTVEKIGDVMTIRIQGESSPIVNNFTGLDGLKKSLVG